MIGDDLTISILRAIRDEISHLRSDTNARFGEVHSRLGETNTRLDFLAEGQVRLGTEVAGLRGEVGELRGEVVRLGKRFDNSLSSTGGRHRDLEGRVLRLEEHVGLTD